MGTYTTTKCGYCNYKFEFMSYGRHSLIGPPRIKCIRCGQFNNTSFTLYRDTNNWQKFSFWIGQFFSRVVYGLFSLIFGSGGLLYLIFSGKYAQMWTDENYFGILFFTAIGAGMSYFGYDSIREMLYTKTACKDIEKVYDENGGYLKSDQFF